MADPQMVMYEEEFRQIQAIVETLVQAANASSEACSTKRRRSIVVMGDSYVGTRGDTQTVLQADARKRVKICRPASACAQRRR